MKNKTTYTVHDRNESRENLTFTVSGESKSNYYRLETSKRNLPIQAGMEKLVLLLLTLSAKKKAPPPKPKATPNQE